MDKIAASTRENLWSALAAGDLDALTHALEAGANPNSAYGKWTPLGKALRGKHLELAHALINAGANVQKEDQGVPMVDLVSGRQNCNDILKTLLAMGAPHSDNSVRMAAASGNGAHVDILMRAGATVLSERMDMAHLRWNALEAWPPSASGPPPAALLDATFTPHLSHETATDICRQCARRQNKWLLQAILDHPQPSSHMINGLLVQCILSKWKEGMYATLEHKKCTPAGLNPRDTSAMAAISQNFRTAKHKNDTIEMLDIIVAYGYHPGIMHEEFVITGNSRQYAAIPAWMDAIKRSAYPTRKTMIEALVEKGANLNDRFGDNAKSYAYGSLLHFFMSTGDVSMAGWLLKKYPDTAWEQEGDPGVIATWASTGPMADAIEIFDALSSFGFDASRPDAYRNSALRNILERSDRSPLLQGGIRLSDPLIEVLGERFVLGGLDLTQKNQSETDIEYARNIGLPETIISKWETAQLASTTKLAAEPYKKIRL